MNSSNGLRSVAGRQTRPTFWGNLLAILMLWSWSDYRSSRTITACVGLWVGGRSGRWNGISSRAVVSGHFASVRQCTSSRAMADGCVSTPSELQGCLYREYNAWMAIMDYYICYWDESLRSYNPQSWNLLQWVLPDPAWIGVNDKLCEVWWNLTISVVGHRLSLSRSLSCACSDRRNGQHMTRRRSVYLWYCSDVAFSWTKDENNCWELYCRSMHARDDHHCWGRLNISYFLVNYNQSLKPKSEPGAREHV